MLKLFFEISDTVFTAPVPNFRRLNVDHKTSSLLRHPTRNCQCYAGKAVEPEPNQFWMAGEHF